MDTDWCLLDGLVPLQMTFWFTVMLLIVGSGDDTGKSRRYKTGSTEPAYSFLHMSLSTGSTLVGRSCNRNMKTTNISSAGVCVCECIYVLRMSCGILLCFQFNVLFTDFHYDFFLKWRHILNINPIKPELNPICYLLALLEAHNFLHVSRIRVKLLTLR